MERFKSKYLPLRFNRNYAMSVLRFRKRVGKTFMYKSGATKRAVLNAQIINNELKMNLPFYTSFRRWKPSPKNRLLDKIITRFGRIGYRQLFKIINQMLGVGGSLLKKIVNRIWGQMKRQKPIIYFDAGKSIKEELETILEREILDCIKNINLT